MFDVLDDGSSSDRFVFCGLVGLCCDSPRAYLGPARGWLTAPPSRPRDTPTGSPAVTWKACANFLTAQRCSTPADAMGPQPVAALARIARGDFVLRWECQLGGLWPIRGRLHGAFSLIGFMLRVSSRLPAWWGIRPYKAIFLLRPDRWCS